MSQFYVGVPEEFVSDPATSTSSGDTLSSQGTNADVSHHVAVLANSMLSELQRLANVYLIDPNEMSSLARLITSALEELDVLVTENAAIESAANQAKYDLEQVVKKLGTEQDLRQTSEKRLWEIQDVVDQERRQFKAELEQMKMSNMQLQERLKAKSNSAQALQDDLEELRKRQAEERQTHLEAIKRYMQDKDTPVSAEHGRAMSNAAVFAPTGTFRRRSSIRSARSKRSNTMSPASMASDPRSPPPPELVEETIVSVSEEAQEGARELVRLRRGETISQSSDDWEAAMGIGVKDAGGMSLQSELSMSDDSRPDSAASGQVPYTEMEGQSLLSDGDVDAVIDDVNQLAKDAAEVDEQRAQLAKENSDLKAKIDELTGGTGELQQQVASLKTSKDHLEAQSRAFREEISRLKDEVASANRKAVVPDFSVQLRKENERLMKLYSFYKEKCQNLQEELSRQNEPLETNSGLKGLFARLLSGLRRRGHAADKQRMVTPTSPSSSVEHSNASSPDIPITGDASSGRQSRASASSSDSNTADSRAPLVRLPPARPPQPSVTKRSPQLTPRRSPNTKRLSLGPIGSSTASSSSSKTKALTISYRARRQTSTEVSINFDELSKPVVTSTGIFQPSGDWLVGSNMYRSINDDHKAVSSCTSQAALFSPEPSKIVAATISTCHGSPTTLDAPLIDLSSTSGDSSAAAAPACGDLCQQMWVCTKQLGTPCRLEILDVIGSASLRHTGTIIDMDALTRNDTVLSMEFMPDTDVATSRGMVSTGVQPLQPTPAATSSVSTANGSSSNGAQDSQSAPGNTSIPTVWMGTDSEDGHVLIYHARPGLQLGEKLQECHFQNGAVTCIRYAFQRAFIGFSNGMVLGFNRQAGTPCGWNMFANDEDTLKLADLSAPVNNRQLNDITCMESVETLLWCACGTYIFSVDPVSLTVVSCARTGSRHPISHMISLGCGVVLTTAHSSKLQFYHLTSLQQLQDFDTAPLQEVVDQGGDQHASGKLCAITSLALCDGSLWVGTGTGVILQLAINTVLDTTSLQMALGAPACSFDSACVSQWSHWSAVRSLMVLQCANSQLNAEDSQDSASNSSRYVVFSGGLGSLDFRNASLVELKQRSRFTSFSTAARSSRGKSHSTVDALRQLEDGAPKFQQLLVWRS
ncbi:uncharacterized protein LOC135830849 [Sycon ciliatum]|uniref:uncharacterized protein LOC135830849 n=1 Tax=Sycon ciliatum TaxID=27933 RepID=UPI0031F6A0DE